MKPLPRRRARCRVCLGGFRTSDPDRVTCTDAVCERAFAAGERFGRRQSAPALCVRCHDRPPRRGLTRCADCERYVRLHKVLEPRDCAHCHRRFLPAPNAMNQRYCKRQACRTARRALQPRAEREISGAAERPPHPFCVATDALLPRVVGTDRARWGFEILRIEAELVRTHGAPFAGVIAFALRERCRLAVNKPYAYARDGGRTRRRSA